MDQVGLQLIEKEWHDRDLANRVVYEIVDFLPGQYSQEPHETVLTSTPDVELVLRHTRADLSTVTPMQWNAANAAIMAKLMQEGDWDVNAINQ